MTVYRAAIPKGTRDILPGQFARRQYIFNSIRNVFTLYGYKPIETPAMEFLSTLTGKYGEEGERLIFKILNSGDFLSGVDAKLYQSQDTKDLARQICEKALRYDLTVPFARFVVQHQNEIHFPFKRYQIQPVWRADRPQKGRYREFFQCDIDVIGSHDLFNEAELLKISDEIFKKLNININLKINNRKILSGITEVLGIAENFTDITVALDKLDKIGWEKVKNELLQKNIPHQAIDKLAEIVKISASNEQKMEYLKDLLKNSETGSKGISEISDVLQYLKNMKVEAPVVFDITLARGLNYYTGAIFEITSRDVAIGSISGGGRYDDLTSIFGMKDISGVGISYGAERIYDVMDKLQLFPPELDCFSTILLVNMGKAELSYVLPLSHDLRKNGISVEVFPDNAKLKKQMNYAHKNNIPFVIIAGKDEMLNNTLTIKNMVSGSQEQIANNTDQIIDFIKKVT